MPSDDFTDSDGTLITAHDSNWKMMSGTAQDIQGNALCPNSTSDAWAYWDDTPTADQYSQITITQKGASPLAMGPAVRIATGAVTAYFIYCDAINWELWRVVNSSFVKIDNASRTLQVGDILYLEAVGDQITFKINGAAVGNSPITDANIASGKYGIYANTDGTTHRGDNWVAGSLGDLSINVAVDNPDYLIQGVKIS